MPKTSPPTTTPTWTPLLLNILPSTTEVPIEMPPPKGCACWPAIARQIVLGLFPLRLLPSLLGDKTCSIFRIGRVSLGLFLAGKVSHRKAVSFDGPPTLGRRPMGTGLDRHHLVGFVGVVVGHFPSTSAGL